ncbi:MAG: SAM-dependent DNA methyltransferase [Planctomycetes bacterium]|nr:SAM-dependent DNA methyltransferase [Planctomycetota bacterium]
MITGELRQRVDRLWEEFWTGGITNPLTVIEQISFLMFSRMLDIRENLNERKAKRLGEKVKVKMIFRPDQQHMRWGNFKQLPAGEMLKVVREEVFPHFKEIGKNGNGEKTTFSEYMADAQLLIQKPSLLVSAINMIDVLPIQDTDAKGDLYEYLLGKLTTAGINGQFRTPRHVIRMMVELVAPKPTDVIADPACGTGGFLVAAMDYLFRTHTSKAGIIRKKDDEGHEFTVYTGDKLEPYRDHIQTSMFYGFDFDVTMLRIASMNLILHGLDNPNVHYCDSLSNALPERFPKLASECFDVILANPPFKGSLDFSDVHSSLTGKVKTRKTELLFVTLMLRMLKTGGRCAVVVPDGVLFGSSSAHRALREMLVNDNQLEAVISLPGGVFRPYASVSTAVLVFAKGGRTSDVFFYDVLADGYTLDDKRTKIGDDKDFQDVTDAPVQWAKWDGGKGKTHFADRTAKAFCVPRSEIVAHEYDLSIGRYKAYVYEEVTHESPSAIVRQLQELEEDIAGRLTKLAEEVR